MEEKEYKDYRTKKSFEKAFKKAIHNFDETKMWFEYKQSKVFVCFVLDGKLRKLPLYKNEYYIELWCNHLIEYFQTGTFDYNAYWRIYGDQGMVGEVLKFSLKEERYDYFSAYSNEMNNYLANYRIEHPGVGIKQIPKIINSKSEALND